MLRTIKLLHTLIWVLFNLVIFYMLYAVVWGDIDYRLWLCYLAIIGEGIVLAAFRLHCPLTVWARRYSDSNKHNFDIYLPEWLAKHNKTIYTSIVVTITIYLIFRLTTQ